MRILEQIEDFMNSQTCREALRIKSDVEFSKYLAKNIASIVSKRIEIIHKAAGPSEYAFELIKDELV